MMLNLLRPLQTRFERVGYTNRSLVLSKGLRQQKIKTNDSLNLTPGSLSSDETPVCNKLSGEILPTARAVPMMVTDRDSVVLSFDDIPGPKALKYLATARNYMTEVGTQITAGLLTFGLNIGSFIDRKSALRSLSVLFDEYGPVVRFISPIGGDIVLINHPDHIQKIYTLEGEYPVRSALDSLEKYRQDHRNHVYGGLFSAQGAEWSRQRSVLCAPLQSSVANHIHSLDEVCDSFTQKVYSIRNYQDEIPNDLTSEIHKWAFDSMGLIIFAKRFTMLDTDLVYSQCDMSWLYHSLDKATAAIVRCESGLHFWKLFTTPAWSNLVKHCDSLDSLIGKHVTDVEHTITYQTNSEMNSSTSLINSLLFGEEKMTTEDITTIIMDMLLIGVNTITSSTSFLLYHLAKYSRSQKRLYKEISAAFPHPDMIDFNNITKETPFLQACIKETLRLVPPIPVITRILPKNVTIDKYNIPRGTLIIISNKDASLKESNYEDARGFHPERWLNNETKDYHAFASIPFGHGSRKCIAQNIAETMMSMLIVRILQKYKLEYHYGDVQPKKRSFIAMPDRPLKIRFIDRV